MPAASDTPEDVVPVNSQPQAQAEPSQQSNGSCEAQQESTDVSPELATMLHGSPTADSAAQPDATDDNQPVFNEAGNLPTQPQNSSDNQAAPQTTGDGDQEEFPHLRAWLEEMARAGKISDAEVKTSADDRKASKQMA